MAYVVYVSDESEGDFEKGYGYDVGDSSLIGTTVEVPIRTMVGDETCLEKRHYVAAFAYEFHADRYRHYLSNHIDPEGFLSPGNLEPFPLELGHERTRIRMGWQTSGRVQNQRRRQSKT